MKPVTNNKNLIQNNDNLLTEIHFALELSRINVVIGFIPISHSCSDDYIDFIKDLLEDIKKDMTRNHEIMRSLGCVQQKDTQECKNHVNTGIISNTNLKQNSNILKIVYQSKKLTHYQTSK